MPDGTPAALPEVVRELYARFGESRFVSQPTKDDVPTLWVTPEDRDAVLRFLKSSLPRPFAMLLDLQAVDERMRRHREGLPPADFTVFYHLLSVERCGPTDSGQVRIKVPLQGEFPSIKSVVGLYANANWYERETWDLFGIRFEEHPHLERILLPRYWQGHPGRKEYSARATEFDPYLLTALRQDQEQAALEFKPEEWGMKRGNDDEDFMFLNLGPNHPSAHGAFRIVLQLDGEEIVDAVPDIGYHHRGAEKMAERQSWHSFIPYTDRIDYLGGVMNNLPYVLAVEKLAGIEVPDRVKTIRVMMAEFFRITSHLLFLGTYLQDMGAMTPVFFMFADRQKAYDVIEAVTGFRMHPGLVSHRRRARTICRGVGTSRYANFSTGFRSASMSTWPRGSRTAFCAAVASASRRTTPGKRSNGALPAPVYERPAAHSTTARRVLTPATSTSNSRYRSARTATPTIDASSGSKNCARAAASFASVSSTCPRDTTSPITRSPALRGASACSRHRDPDHALPRRVLGSRDPARRVDPADRGHQGDQQLLPHERRQHHEL